MVYIKRRISRRLDIQVVRERLPDRISQKVLKCQSQEAK